MKNITSIFLIAVGLLTFSGCAESKDLDAQTNDVGGGAPSDHFKSHFADAGRFLDLKHRGDDYKDKGMYEDAINAYEEALTDHAYSRPEQAIASSRIASTYELMENYEMAARYYEMAAETTMNRNQAESYRETAKDLRQKAGLPVAEEKVPE